MRSGFLFRFSVVCILSLLAVIPAAGQGSRRWSWRMLQDWLKSEHEKVVSDADRIVVLTRNLRHEVEEKRETAGVQGIAERAREMEVKAQKLQEAVKGANKDFLSVAVVRLAGELRAEAQSLGKKFADHPARRKLERFRLFCREIEQRSEAVRKRASNP